MAACAMAPELAVPALQAARRRDDATRLRLLWQGEPIGSVERAALPALAGWGQHVGVEPDAVHWLGSDPATLESALAAVNQGLREAGWVRAWRDEPFAVFGLGHGRPLLRIERAAARFWGTLTLGAHCTGWVAGPDGRPQRLWIARRAAHKPTDPGLHDNLIGGGVGAGQTPLSAVQREGFEEAGLTPATMQAVRHGSVLRLHRAVDEGLQLEDLHSFDLALPAGLTPENQDGEVAGFKCLALGDALRLALGEAMTVDAALVTLDFLTRHGLLEEAGLGATAAQHVASGLAALHPGASDPFVTTLTFSEGLRQGG